MEKRKTYTFTSDERTFVQAKLAQVEGTLAEMRGVFNFIASREKLQGAWDLSPDREGLISLEKSNG
jgi:hypothetical protein